MSDYSAFSAGLAFIPMGIVFLVISAFLAERLVNRFGIKAIIILGMALQTIGYLLLSSISIKESYFGGLLGPTLLNGLGTGLGFTAINIAALTGTRRGEEGLASGLINTSHQIGGPIGLVVLLTVANFETPALTGHLVYSAPTAATMVMVCLCVLGGCTANWDWNYLYGLSHKRKTISSRSSLSHNASVLRALICWPYG